MNNEALMNWVEQIFRRRTLALRVGLLVFGVIAIGSKFLLRIDGPELAVERLL